MSAPLTDSIQNLTSYINEVTGGEDNNLSDAIATLAAGYGSGGYSLKDIASGSEPRGDIVMDDGNTIGHSAFYRRTKIRSFSSESVTTIQANAFVDCSGLSSVNFPNLTYMSTGVFSSCSNLEYFNAPKLRSVPTSTFSGNKLKNVVLPAVVEVQGYAFKGCNLLEKVALASCTSINNAGFYNVSSNVDIYLPGLESEYTGAPWGARNATIHYNTQFDENGEPILE
jgi:hypothetical protein